MNIALSCLFYCAHYAKADPNPFRFSDPQIHTTAMSQRGQ